MTDRTCDVCERLWDQYEQAIQSQRIIEGHSGTETGLEGLVRKASNRREEARMALEDHETTHMTVTATASIVALAITMNPDGSERSEHNEVHERCDGCRQPHPASELSFIGDGSIKVCLTCRAEAITMVRE